jgi:hypothetical protein
MSLAVTERTKDTEHDPVVEFREGVELLKNEYPEKALVRLRRSKATSVTLITFRFLGCRLPVLNRSGTKPRNFAKVRYS